MELPSIMYRHFRILTSFLCVFLAVNHVSGQTNTWQNDFDTAIQQACAAHKDNLLIFTIMESNEASRNIHEEVIENTECTEQLSMDYILTHIDLPQTPREQKELSDLESRQYSLARALKLCSFPAIFLCTEEGAPYFIAEYTKGSFPVLLQSIHDAKADYMKAMTATGIAKARALDAWLESLPKSLRDFHSDKYRIIAESDPQNSAGLRLKYKMALMLPEARELRYTGKLDESEALYLQIVEELKPTGEELQNVYYELGDVYFQRKDYNQLLATLDNAIQAAPEGSLMDILNEMMLVFTQQSVYVKYKPDEMKAVDYDFQKIDIPNEDIPGVLKLITEARNAPSESRRHRILDQMEAELTARLKKAESASGESSEAGSRTQLEL